MNQALPRRIQEQLAEADRLEQQDSAARAATATVHPAVSSAADLVQAPTAPTPSAPPQAPPPPAQPPAPAEDFEQKYKTLQGMYNSEVPSLRRKAQEQDQTLARMAEQLRSLTEAKPAAPAEPQPSEADDVRAMGPDLVEYVNRIAVRSMNAVLSRLEPRFAALEGQVKGVETKSAETAEQQFYALLTRLVPDWEQINTTDEWKKWCLTKDKVYGVPRQAGLDNAFARLDAEQVAVIFSVYKDSLPKAPPPPPSLQDQLAPNASGGAALPTPTVKPILSTKAINAFYRQLTQGEFNGREEQAAAIEAEINLAVAEGRVR
jgi:hypothetical protein